MKEVAQLMLMINVDSVDQAREFYLERLGFDHQMGMLGKDGQLDFCTVTLGAAKIMFMRPQERMEGVSATAAKRSVEFYIPVPDVDAYYNRLKKNKIKVTTPLTDQWWGDRTFTLLDPFGYQLWFYQTIADPKLPDGAKIV